MLNSVNDKTITRILSEIQKEMSIEYNVHIEHSTIKKIFNQQIKFTADNIPLGHTIVWKYFGTFLAPEKNIEMRNKYLISKGKTPTLIDTGYQVVSLTPRKNG